MLLFSAKGEAEEEYLPISRLFLFASHSLQIICLLCLIIALYYSTLSTTGFSFLFICRQNE